MVPLLVVVSFAAGLIGFVMLSQATQGVGVIALACLVAILARLGQAEAQHTELLRRLTGLTGPTAAPQPTPARVEVPYVMDRTTRIGGIAIGVLIVAVFVFALLMNR